MQALSQDERVLSRLLSQIKLDSPNLDLSYERLEDSAIAYLCRKHDLSRVRTLDLSWNQLTDFSITEILNCQSLKCIEVLKINSNLITDVGAKKIAQATNLSKLKHLDLTNNQIQSLGALEIVKSKTLLNLYHLDLELNQIGQEPLPHFPDGTALSSLKTLNLRHNQMDAQTLKDWAETGALTHLEHLNLGWNAIDDEAAVCLAKSPTVKSINNLILDHNYIGDLGAKALAQSKNLKKSIELYLQDNDFKGMGETALYDFRIQALLEKKLQDDGTLHLNGVKLGNKGLQALMRAERWQSVKALSLRNNAIDYQGLIDHAQNLKNLDVLDLMDNPLGNKGAVLLAEVPFSSLKTLNLENTHLSYPAISAFCQSANWSQLEKMNLSSNLIGREGMEWLAEFLKRCPSLTKLWVWNAGIGDKGLDALVSSPHFGQIEELRISRNALSPEGIQNLLDKKPQTLKTLDLRGNSPFSVDLLAKLDEIRPAFQTLEY